MYATLITANKLIPFINNIEHFYYLKFLDISMIKILL